MIRTLLLLASFMFVVPLADRNKVQGQGDMFVGTNIVGTYEASSGGDVLTLQDTEDMIMTIYWVPGSSWYASLDGRYMLETTCIQWNIDGCIKWVWTAFWQSNPGDVLQEIGHGTMGQSP